MAAGRVETREPSSARTCDPLLDSTEPLDTSNIASRSKYFTKQGLLIVLEAPGLMPPLDMKNLCNFAFILATFAAVVVGQGKPDLDRLGEKISSQLESRLPGWHYKRVEPFQPSSTILVQGWSSENRIVKVAVAVRQSVEDAKKEIKSFLQFRRDPEQLSGFGDEAFAPERDGSSIVVRRGRYVIYISTVAEIESDADARNLSEVELAARRKSEVKRIGREFAKQLSSIELE